jgi:hypothetical protein
VAYELRLRWRAQREGSERLSGACYAILTGLESNLGGNRDKAAARLSVEAGVEHNRQTHGAGRSRARTGVREGHEGAAGLLTEAEVKWLEAVTPRLIRLAADYETKVPSLLQITMADLPPLSDNGHHRCVRPWLLVAGLFVAVQPIRKPATGPQHSREL